MAKKSQTQEAIGRMLARVDTAKLIEQVGPKLLPGIVGNMPIAQQLGLTPDLIHGLLNAAPQQGQADTLPAIPSGGAFRLMRDWPLITDAELRAAIETIANHPTFQDVYEETLDAIYAAIGINAAKGAQQR